MFNIPKNASVIVLTGAGISVASGIAPFRGLGGIWDADPELLELATVDGWRKNPRKVLNFMDAMKHDISRAQPNEAHRALARAEMMRSDMSYRFTIVTQNVDGLRQKAHSTIVHELHGSFASNRCDRCGRIFYKDEKMCSRCRSLLRPNIVLFGEDIPEIALAASVNALANAAFFVAVGTSGNVSPAADFAGVARRNGLYCINVNIEPCENPAFDEEIIGKAEDILPILFGV